MSKTTIVIEFDHIPGDNKTSYDMIKRTVHVGGTLEYTDTITTRMSLVDKTPITALNNWLLGKKTTEDNNPEHGDVTEIQLMGEAHTKQKAIEKITEIINSMTENTVINDLIIRGEICLKKHESGD